MIRFFKYFQRVLFLRIFVPDFFLFFQMYLLYIKIYMYLFIYFFERNKELFVHQIDIL